MEVIKQEKLLSRSKSAVFLNKLDDECHVKCFSARFRRYSESDNSHAIVSSVDACFGYHDTEWSAEQTNSDNGLYKSFVESEALLVLDQKIDKLNELLQEQHNLLASIKENVIKFKVRNDRRLSPNKIYMKGFKEENPMSFATASTNQTAKVGATCDNGTECETEASAARSMLYAIEMKQDISLDNIIRTALEKFLQSDSVRDHVAAATVECVKGVVHRSFSRVISNAYLPMVERSHCRLIKHVTKLLGDSFKDLEEGTASLYKSIHKTSRDIRMSLEKHQNLLEATNLVNNIKILRTTLKGVLEEELGTWRKRVIQELSSESLWNNSGDVEPDPPYEYIDYSPMSPMQPANPETSVIDTLMKCAIINKHVKDGDIDRAFEEALSSADLSLVMAACRAAEPAACALRPAALLSLLQQLATDMVHDTQLKCRYLEEVLLRLEKCDAATREHLPLVVKDVRKHLTKFLLSYPKHHASRRIALIVMAVNNLLK